MTTGKQNLYFIAIVLPDNICKEVTAFKQDFADRFESRRALKVVPHITLKAPFKLPAVSHEQIVHWFENMQISVSSFQQDLKDFGAFKNKRNPVVYVQPVMNAALHNLQKQVLVNFINAYPEEGILKLELEFSPHVTVAYRDLQLRQFEDAWKQYESKTYSAKFEVNSFQLLQHDSRKWNTISNYNLRQPC